MFDLVAPTDAEISAVLPGDAVVPADVVMDRGFTLDAAPEHVWPWLVQVGKGRAGWYLPRSVERFIPAARRGSWTVVAALQTHAVGDTIADWGGKDATLTLDAAAESSYLSYRSQRGRSSLSWTLLLTPLDGGRTRVHSRVRVGPVRRTWLAESVGGRFDEATIAGLAAGLQERLRLSR